MELTIIRERPVPKYNMSSLLCAVRGSRREDNESHPSQSLEEKEQMNLGQSALHKKTMASATVRTRRMSRRHAVDILLNGDGKITRTIRQAPETGTPTITTTTTATTKKTVDRSQDPKIPRRVAIVDRQLQRQSQPKIQLQKALPLKETAWKPQKPPFRTKGIIRHDNVELLLREDSGILSSTEATKTPGVAACGNSNGAALAVNESTGVAPFVAQERRLAMDHLSSQSETEKGAITQSSPKTDGIKHQNQNEKQLQSETSYILPFSKVPYESDEDDLIATARLNSTVIINRRIETENKLAQRSSPSTTSTSSTASSGYSNSGSSTASRQDPMTMETSSLSPLCHRATASVPSNLVRVLSQARQQDADNPAIEVFVIGRAQPLTSRARSLPLSSETGTDQADVLGQSTVMPTSTEVVRVSNPFSQAGSREFWSSRAGSVSQASSVHTGRTLSSLSWNHDDGTIYSVDASTVDENDFYGKVYHYFTKYNEAIHQQEEDEEDDFARSVYSSSTTSSGYATLHSHKLATGCHAFL